MSRPESTHASTERISCRYVPKPRPLPDQAQDWPRCRRKSSSSGGIEADGQAFDAEDDEAVLGLEVGFGRAVQLGKAAQEGGEGDARFQAGQRRTQTKVNAVPEGEVLVRIAAQGETVRAGENLLVAIGRANPRQDRLARLQGVAAERRR